MFRAPNQFTKEHKQELQNSKSATDEVNVSYMIINFIVRDKSGRTQALQSDSGIGVLFFSAACGLQMPVHEMELDCRGSVEKLEDRLYFVTVGEIKSSFKSAGAASQQLKFKLAVLERAIKCCYGEDVEVKKMGLVYLPATEPRFINPPEIPGITIQLIYI